MWACLGYYSVSPLVTTVGAEIRDSCVPEGGAMACRQEEEHRRGRPVCHFVHLFGVALGQLGLSEHFFSQNHPLFVHFSY